MLISSNTTSSTFIIPEDHDPTILILAEVTFIYQWVFYSVICQLICIFGIGTNVINIICFKKQGFQDPVNVSLLGLAVSDMGSLITLMWTNLCMNPAFSATDLPFHPFETQFLVTGMPHATLACITGWITALTTLERCLCITLPLKVKTIITPRRMSTIVVFVFIIIISCQVPFYVVNKLGLKYFPHKNKTIIGLIYLKGREDVENISFIINNSFFPFCAFIVITVCTVTLVVQLHQKTKWRIKTTTGKQADVVSIRNQKVAKMVVMISTIFIVCFIPVCVAFIAASLIPGFELTGKYRDAIIFIAGIGGLLETINSSVNIFVYYHMSSKYKVAFKSIFHNTMCR